MSLRKPKTSTKSQTSTKSREIDEVEELEEPKSPFAGMRPIDVEEIDESTKPRRTMVPTKKKLLKSMRLKSLRK